ncbi:MAG: PorT family protein, partial [Pedobacter sp.]
VNTMYLEIPVNVVGKIPAGSGNVFVGAGPYFGYALSGKSKAKVSVSGGGINESDSSKEDLEFGSEDGEFKRVELGVNFLGGYQLKNGLNINFGYGLGLSNLVNNSSGDGKASNRVLSVGLGFNF